MKEVVYQGENLFLGNLGHFLVVLAFCTAIFGSIAYFLSVSRKEPLWRKSARVSFWIHTFAVTGVFITLFTIIYGHYFEYQYAWQHSSRNLPWYYMLSCFWEGQEGSFLLWLFWNALIGIVFVYTVKKWESPVLSIICLTQVVLSSMLLGIDLGEVYTIGSSPFNLLREKMALQAPIFRTPDYLESITDGRGLNPLLQNYWMVIHPPTLFLGFASSIIPFAFAVSGLWTRKYKEWLKPALPWTLISVMVLGTGIIMGGFWAYESLSFGGYWAWDPVENASLVPWLLLITTLHLMLIYKSTGTSIILTYILSIASFLLVLYATFLTRSGILGDTSVHSFTDLGLSGQLMMFMFIFYALPLFAILHKKAHKIWMNLIYWTFFLLNIILGIVTKNETAFLILKWIDIAIFVSITVLFVQQLYKTFPVSKTEESFKSRELWMFVGSLLLLLSAFQVTLVTSFPVINKLFGTKIAPPTDAIAYYNKFQLPIAILIALLVAVTQYFKYKTTKTSKVLIHILKTFAISVVLSLGAMFLFEIYKPAYLVLLISGVYAVVANFAYFFEVLKGKINLAGASIAHIGFGFMLVGILVSSAKKEVISINETVDFGSAMDDKGKRENILLLKGDTLRMKDYLVTYTGDTFIEPNTFYKVSYKGIGNNEEFVLEPNAQISNNQLNSNPDTRHYLTHDVYTYVSNIPDREKQMNEPWEEPKPFSVEIGDTVKCSNGAIVFESIDKNARPEDLRLNHQMWAANLKILAGQKTFRLKPIFAITDQSYYTIEDVNNEAGIKAQFYIKSNGQGVSAYLDIAERPPVRDFIIMKAIVFPYINFLWGGVILMVIGFVISIVRRTKDYRRSRES
ncbi:MAG: cytochrome c biogenesis protein CcsA [Flavobacteriales bacterium]|nr:cytochrome c biogenesis protein CcsA [Flavobacteriales bacterium]